MADERVKVTVDAGVAEVALARADKMNALDPAMFEAINATIARLGTTPGLRAVVLHGEGRAFCAGLDMASFSTLGEGPAARDLAARTHGEANAFQQVAWGWRRLPVPVVAAVHGVAFGGGLQIALGADLRLAAPGTRLSAMEIQWGIVPDMAGFALAAGLVRDDHLRELVYTGRIVEAEEAVGLGLVTRVSADPLAEARTIARQIAGRNPDAVRAAKRLAGRLPQATPAEVLLAEAREQQALIGSRNQVEAVQATLARRAPDFVD
jgi:enoyl-CoA hydratase/carnithine racemase